MGNERRRDGDSGSSAPRGRQEPTERSGRKGGLLETPKIGGPRAQQRGLFSTKLHLACDRKGRPLSVVITSGQRHGSMQLEQLLDTVRIARPKSTPGRPRKRTAHLLADRGYSFESCRRDCYVEDVSPTPSPSAQTKKSVAPGVRDAGPASTGRLTGSATW